MNKEDKKKLKICIAIYAVMIILLFFPIASVIQIVFLDPDMNVVEKILNGSNLLKEIYLNPMKNFHNIISEFFGILLITFQVSVICAIPYSWTIYKKYFKKKEKGEYEGKEHGSSEWAKDDEEFDPTPDGKEILNREHGFILSKDHYLGTDLKKVAINKNILVFGGSGTGKSACYVKPNILQKLGSYVITDPKGELYRETSEYLKANGYEVKVLNLVDPEYSDRYNPLAHIADYADVDIIAHTIVSGGNSATGGDPFWDNTAVMLLKACIYYVISSLPEEERNLSSCLNIVRAGGADDTIFDKLFIDELDPTHPGRKEYESIRVGNDKTKQSIAISLVSKLSHFDSPNMQRLTTSNNISFEDLGKKKMALYVISPDSHSTYNYILTIFYGQLLQRLYAQADRNGGALQEQVYLLLDEFANIGKIPDFNQKLSTSRSRGISMSIIVQSIDQLIDLYKDLYENILANCDTHIFLGSQSIKTCEYISKSLGQQTIKSESKSKDKDKKEVSYNEQTQGRELMTVDEVKRLPMDELIIIVRGIKPIRAKKAYWFKYHPAREFVEKYNIKDITQMPKPEAVPICTLNVEEHFNVNKRLAKERQNIEYNDVDINLDIGGPSIDTSPVTNSSPAEISIDSASEPTVKMNDLSKEEDTFDIQVALEQKFDQLFGSASDDIL